MYHVLIKTLPDNLSTFIPHLVEHCVLGNKNLLLEEFFFRTLGYTGISYTHFEVQNSIKKEVFLKRILGKIDIKVYEYEKKILQKELSKRFTDEGYQTLSQIYGHIDFDIYQDVGFDTIVTYHDRFYKANNIMFYDESRKIIDTNNNLELAEYSGLDLKTFTHNFHVSMNKIKVFTLSTSIWENVIFMYFLSNLFYHRHTKKKRYELGEYYYKNYSWGMSINHIYIRGPSFDEYVVTEDFFNAFKESFILKMIDGYHNEPLAFWTLYNHKIVPDKYVRKFVNELEYSTIVSIMTKSVEQHNNSIQEKYQRASEFQISIGEEPVSYEQFTMMYTTYLKELEGINK